MQTNSSKSLSPYSQKELIQIERLSELLDSKFEIPGTKFRFGLDAIIGLVPGIGDFATTFVSFFIIYRAAKMGVSKRALSKLVSNLMIDSAVGVIPIVGDIFDVTYKANLRNLKIIKEELQTSTPQTRRDKSLLKFFLISLVSVLFLTFLLAVLLIAGLIQLINF